MRPPPSGTFSVPEMEEETGIDFRRYLDLFLRHWKLIVAVVVVVAGIAIVRTYLTAPVFRAAAVISIEREKVALSDLGLGEGMLTMRDPDFIPTQIRMIKGRDVLEHVGLDPEAVEGGLEAGVDLVRAEATRGVDVGKTGDGDVLEQHGAILARGACRRSGLCRIRDSGPFRAI